MTERPAPFDLLYEDNHLLVVIKPAMLPTMGVPEGRSNLLQEAKDYVRHKYAKPGNVYLGVVSRLDAPVTGAIVIARTSKAARRLTEQFRNRQIDKIYWAVIQGSIRPAQGDLQNYVRKDERHRKMHVTDPDTPGAVEARLAYRTLDGVGQRTLVEVRLDTGRKHQIRLQMAHQGFPILGDRKYGSRQTFPHGIALHCRRLRFEHPVRHCPLEVTAPLPVAWRHLGLDENQEDMP